MLWKTLLGAAGLYGGGIGEVAVIHSFLDRVKGPPKAHRTVQVFDFEGGFWCNSGFPGVFMGSGQKQRLMQRNGKRRG
jgi:hypothetical protein